MPVPSVITDLSTTVGSNSPAGSESASGTIDDYLRAHAGFIAQTRAGTSATTYTFSAANVQVLMGSASATNAYDGASWKWLGFQVNSRNTTADTNQIVFYNPNGSCGFINTNGTATSYNTSSDYRLKSNQQALAGSGAFIDALLPKTWTWADGSSGVGFIAHEAAQVAPRSVSGQKDAVNADGTPNYQGMDYGSGEIIANMVAELKSLRARVAVLEAA